MVFLVQPRPLHHYSCFHLWPSLHTTTDSTDNQVITMKFCCHNAPLRCSTIPSAVFSSVTKRYPLGDVVADEGGEYRDMEVPPESNACSNSHYNEESGESGTLSSHYFEEVLMCSMKELKETLRRRRIGLANKGKVPWNKGIKHSRGKCCKTFEQVVLGSTSITMFSDYSAGDTETCERIRERTLEAMRDPKVRRKMSESPRVHSEQSKKKIGASIKQLWVERLKRKHSKEKFISLWAASIAESARRGGINEEQLNWNSYDKLKEEIALQQLKKNVEKVKKREMKKIQVETRVQERVKDKAQRALEALDDKHKAEPKAKKKATRSGRRKKKNDTTVSEKSGPKTRRTKIQGKKLIDTSTSTQSAVMSYLHAALEKFDIESIKEEQKRKTMSLAEQIQAAKSKRHEMLIVDPK